MAICPALDFVCLLLKKSEVVDSGGGLFGQFFIVLTPMDSKFLWLVFVCCFLNLLFRADVYAISQNEDECFILDYFSELEIISHSFFDDDEVFFYLSPLIFSEGVMAASKYRGPFLFEGGEKSIPVGKKLKVNHDKVIVKSAGDKFILVSKSLLDYASIKKELRDDERVSSFWRRFLDNVLMDEELVLGEGYSGKKNNVRESDINAVVYELSEESGPGRVVITRCSFVFNLYRIKLMLLLFGGMVNGNTMALLQSYLCKNKLSPIVIEDYAETFFNQLVDVFENSGGIKKEEALFIYNDKKDDILSLWGAIEHFLKINDCDFESGKSDQEVYLARFFRDYNNVLSKGNKVELYSASNIDPLGLSFLHNDKQLDKKSEWSKSLQLGTFWLSDDWENSFRKGKKFLQSHLKNKIAFWDRNKESVKSQASLIDAGLAYLTFVESCGEERAGSNFDTEEAHRCDSRPTLMRKKSRNSYIGDSQASLTGHPSNAQSATYDNRIGPFFAEPILKQQHIDEFKYNMGEIFASDMKQNNSWIKKSILPDALLKICGREFLGILYYVKRMVKGEDFGDQRKRVVEVLDQLWRQPSDKKKGEEKAKQFFSELFALLGNEKGQQLCDELVRQTADK